MGIRKDQHRAIVVDEAIRIIGLHGSMRTTALLRSLDLEPKQRPSANELASMMDQDPRIIRVLGGGGQPITWGVRSSPEKGKS